MPSLKSSHGSDNCDTSHFVNYVSASRQMADVETERILYKKLARLDIVRLSLNILFHMYLMYGLNYKPFVFRSTFLPRVSHVWLELCMLSSCTQSSSVILAAT